MREVENVKSLVVNDPVIVYETCMASRCAKEGCDYCTIITRVQLILDSASMELRMYVALRETTCTNNVINTVYEKYQLVVKKLVNTLGKVTMATNVMHAPHVLNEKHFARFIVAWQVAFIYAHAQGHTFQFKASWLVQLFDKRPKGLEQAFVELAALSRNADAWHDFFVHKKALSTLLHNRQGYEVDAAYAEMKRVLHFPLGQRGQPPKKYIALF